MSTEHTVPSVGVVEAQDLMQQPDTTVLDVRSPGEYETAHIDGAVNLPVDRLDQHAQDIADRVDGTVVLVCRSGRRAEQAATKLGRAGKEDLVLLAGGMDSWQSAGAPVDANGVEKWDLERQVRLVAGAIVFLAVLVSAWVPGTEWIAAGIGLGLVVAAVTNTCALGMMLSRLPYNRGGSSDFEQSLARLGAR